MDYYDKLITKSYNQDYDKELDSRELIPILRSKWPTKAVYVSKNNKYNGINTEYCWFVFESDTLSYDEQLAYIHNPIVYRAVYSGNKSIHLWVRVENATFMNYEKIAVVLNHYLLDDYSCKSCLRYDYRARAPNVTNPDTGKLQELLSNDHNCIMINDTWLNKLYKEYNDSIIAATGESIL